MPAQICTGSYQKVRYTADTNYFGINTNPPNGNDAYDGDLDSIYDDADINFISPFTDGGAQGPLLNSIYTWGAVTALPTTTPGSSSHNTPDETGGVAEAVVYSFRVEGTASAASTVSYADSASHDVMLVTVENASGVVLASQFLDGDGVSDSVPGVTANTNSGINSGTLSFTYPATGAAFLRYYVVDLGGGYGSVLDGGCVATVSSVSVPSDGSYKEGDTLSFTVNTSDNVTVVTTGGTPQIALTIGSTTRQATYASGTGTSSLVFSYTVQASETDTDGIAVGSLSANGGTLKDSAGNDLNLTLNSVGSTSSVLVDTTAPTISSVSLNAANDALTVTFAEDVYNTNGGSGDLEVSDFAISISGGTATVTATPSSITKTSQSVWVLGVSTSGTADGNETLSVVPSGAAAIYDVAGNAASTTQSNNTASLTEKVAPTMTITAAEVSDGDASSDGTLSLTFTSSEATTTFAVGDITVTNGSISNFASTSSTVYTATFTPAADGATTIDVAGGAFTDAAGNNNTAASQFNWTYDATGPTMTITAAEVSDGDASSDGTLSLT
ncbi:Ig-like domain-containing protein, partial [Alphaproteobacteria bacterium LSUCC0719]